MALCGKIWELDLRALSYFLLLCLLTVTARDLRAQPANDNCITAQPVVIPAGGTVCISSSSLTATSSNTTNPCNVVVVNEVWFSYIVAGPVNMITVTPSGGTPIQQAVITVSDAVCGSGTFNVCDAAPTAGGIATANWAYTPGNQVYVSVAGILGDGTFQICITSETPPPTPGSTCAGATPTCDPSSFTLNSSAGNFSSGTQPSCFALGPAQNDMWYVFTVGQTGTFEFTATVNGNAEYDWAVYNITAGCPGTEVTCNYFFSNGTTSFGLGPPGNGEFNPAINVTAGNTYAILVDNYSNNGVGFDFTWGGTFQMAPTSDFTVNTPSACNTLTTTFTNNSVGATSYAWDFGNGSSSTLQNPPAQTYNTPGTYFVTLMVTSGAGCSHSFSASVEVFPDPTLSFVAVDETCTGSCDGQLTVNASGTGPFVYNWAGGGNSATETNLSANTYNITVTDQSNGCSATGSGTVGTGGAVSDATINAPVPPDPYCELDAAVQLTTVDPGGTWTGNGVNATGIFDPATAGAGTHTITYTIAGPCGDVGTISLQVLAEPDPTINPPVATVFCESDPAVQLTAASNGGTWTGNGVSPTGLFDPAAAGQGIHIVTHSTVGSCTGSDQIQLTVNTDSDATINPANPVGPYCDVDPAIQLTTVQAGGNWSGNGVNASGLFDPATAGIGMHTITYTIVGLCGDVGTISMQVISVIDPTIDPPASTVLCESDPAVQLTAASNGGLWTGNGVSPTGLFDPAAAGLGIHTVTHSTVGSCAGSDQIQLTVNADSDATINPANPVGPYCNVDPAIQLTTMQAGGNWSGNGVNASGLFDPATAGIGMHTITYTIVGLCGDVGTISMQVISVIDPTIDPPASTVLCESDPAVQLTAASNGGLWTGNGVSPTGLFDPAAAGQGTHTITHTSVGSCTGTDQIQLMVNADSDATINPINGTNSLCLNAVPMQLTAVDAGGTWTGNGVSPIGIFDPATAGIGTHTITYTISNPCGDSQTIDITVNDVTFTNSITDVACSGDADGEIQISNETGTAPHLFSIDGGTVTQGTGLFQGLAPGNYSLVVVDAAGCISQPVAVSVSEPNPIVLNAVMDQQSSCGIPDGQVSVTVSGGTVAVDYLYGWNSNPAQNSATATGLPPGTYTVAVTDDNGCSETASVAVTGTAAFTVSISSFTDALCFQSCDGDATAMVSAGATLPIGYSWNSNPVQNTATATGLCAGNYDVAATDAVGCIAYASVVISEPPQLIVSVAAAPDSICIGESSTLTAALLGGTTPYSAFLWTAAPIDPNLVANLQNPTVSPIGTTGYTLVATDANGCSSAPESVTVVVRPPLALSVTLPITVDIGICPGDQASIDLQATGGDGNYSYYLLPNTNTTVTLPMSVQPSATTTYNFSVSDGCASPVATTSSTITVYSLPVVDFSVDGPGCDPHTAHFTDLTVPTPASWIWDFGDPAAPANSSINQNPANLFSGLGTYDITLTVVTADVCTTSLTQPNFMEVFAPPYAIFELDPQHASALDPRITFTDLSSSAVTTWNWDFGDGDFSPDQHPIHAYLDTGEFTVLLQVFTADGCEDTISHTLTIDPILTFRVPNAFTPDKDRINDGFRAFGEGYDFSSYTMSIYDRWGKELFSTTQIETKWNGKYNSKKLPVGTYVWRVKVSDLNGRIYPFSGHVTLIR